MMENDAHLSEVDTLAAEQFFGIYAKPRFLEPERELMLAVLTDAVDCIFKYSNSSTDFQSSLFHDAHTWFFMDDDRDPFSFLNVCSALSFDPTYLRQGVAKKIREIAKEKYRRVSDQGAIGTRNSSRGYPRRPL